LLFVAVVKLLYLEAFLVRLVFQSLEMDLASQSPESIAEVMLLEFVVGAGILPGDASPGPCPTSYISAGSEKSGLDDTNAAGSANMARAPPHLIRNWSAGSAPLAPQASLPHLYKEESIAVLYILLRDMLH
jgi:hypothetical protein